MSSHNPYKGGLHWKDMEKNACVGAKNETESQNVLSWKVPAKMIQVQLLTLHRTPQ